MMTVDFLVGAIRASEDLHPQVKTEIEEILHNAEPDEPIRGLSGERFYCVKCRALIPMYVNYCADCGKRVKWE